MTLQGLISNLETLPMAVKLEVNQIVLDNAADLNREQLRKGINADGEQISKQIIRAGATDYAPSYKKLRKRKGLQTKHIDAKFSGKYHESLDAKKKGTNKYEITSNDPKRNTVEENLGDLRGLNENATEKLTTKIVNGVTKLIFKKVK